MPAQATQTPLAHPEISDGERTRREKISKSLIGNKRRLGIPHDEKTKKMFSDLWTGEKNPRWSGGYEAYLKRQGEGKRRHRLYYNELEMRRNALKRGTTVGPVKYNEIMERDGMICYLCSDAVTRDRLHFDHVMPLSKGGTHTMDNIRVTHDDCNRRKHAKILS